MNACLPIFRSISMPMLSLHDFSRMTICVLSHTHHHPLLSSTLLSCFNGGTFLNVVLRRMSLLHLSFWCFKFIYLKLKSLICNLSLLFWQFKKLDKEHYWRPLSSSLGASSGFREKLTASAGLGNIWGQSDFSTIRFCASVSLFFSSPPKFPVYIHRQTQSAILWQ